MQEDLFLPSSFSFLLTKLCLHTTDSSDRVVKEIKLVFILDCHKQVHLSRSASCSLLIVPPIPFLLDDQTLFVCHPRRRNMQKLRHCSNEWILKTTTPNDNKWHFSKGKSVLICESTCKRLKTFTQSYMCIYNIDIRI